MELYLSISVRSPMTVALQQIQAMLQSLKALTRIGEAVAEES